MLRELILYASKAAFLTAIVTWCYCIYRYGRHHLWRIPLFITLLFIGGLQLENIVLTIKLKSLEKSAAIHATAIHTNQLALEKIMKLEIYRQTQEYMSTETDVTK